jgi:N-acetylneuraminate synthase
MKLIAEIGINHNGLLDHAVELGMWAEKAGFDYIKLQKRTPEKCVPKAQQKKMKSTPWGEMTYLDYKKVIELDKNDYKYLKSQYDKIGVFASVWDMESAEIMESVDSSIVKVPSAKLTDHELLKWCRDHFETLIISTGMSTEAEIESAVSKCGPDVIIHTNSVYPTPTEHCNLGYIRHLMAKYPYLQIGYSSHYYGLTDCFAAAAMGVTWIEKHVTLDRNMWGSDQASSVEPVGMIKLAKGLRDIEAMMGGDCDRVLYPGEEIKKEALRG